MREISSDRAPIEPGMMPSFRRVSAERTSKIMGLRPESIRLASSAAEMRAILSRLGQGPASVGELAAPFDMALTSFMKHLKILERSGWITTAKAGRVRTCAIVTDRFADVGAWVYRHRALFERR